MKFAEMTVTEFLEALSRPDPTPGGGTAAAVAGAMGTALLVMVTGLAKSNTNTDDEKNALATARQALQPLVATLVELADADAAAFDQVMSAYRLPKTNEDEKGVRAAAIQAALHGATTVPLQTLRACARAMAHAEAVAACGNRSAASDVGVAIGLLEAAAAGAEANVRINLGSVKDLPFASAAGGETNGLVLDVTNQAAAARSRLS